MAALVDTNVLVYRYDHRFPGKQRIADEILRWGIENREVYLPHQAIVEFVAAVGRPRENGLPLLSSAEAVREAEEMLDQFEILWPSEEIVRIALRGAAAYQMSGWDAHLWAYAEFHGLPELLSEDFENGRLYGTVRVVDPFRAPSEVHEPSTPYRF